MPLYPFLAVLAAQAACGEKMGLMTTSTVVASSDFEILIPSVSIGISLLSLSRFIWPLGLPVLGGGDCWLRRRS